MSIHIEPTPATRPTTPISDAETTLNSLTSKVNELIGPVLTNLKSFLSSIYSAEDFVKKTYHVIHISLSTLAWTGYALSIILCFDGLIKTAVIVSLLSTANLIGAYAAYQAATQQSLAESATQLENHVAQTGLLNTQLNLQVRAQKAQVHAQRQENDHLKGNVVHLRKIIDRLRQAINSLINKTCRLKQEIFQLDNQNKQLKTTQAALTDQVSLFTFNNTTLAFIRDNLGEQVDLLQTHVSELALQTSPEYSEWQKKYQNCTALYCSLLTRLAQNKESPEQFNRDLETLTTQLRAALKELPTETFLPDSTPSSSNGFVETKSAVN